MITCQDARHLFSRYLEDDLPSSLQTELHAHQLNCPSCRDELAMLETCGNVIALDRREPKPDEAFTERVLAARRAQLADTRPYRRSRLLWYGGPSLAAAGIALVFFIAVPWSGQGPKTVISGEKVAAPVEARKVLTELSGEKPVTDEAKAGLESTDEMPLPIFSRAVEKYLQKTQTTLENTRQGAKDLERLFFLTLFDMLDSEELSNKWSKWQEEHVRDSDDSSLPYRKPSTEPQSDNVSEAL